ncbi:MAG: NAD-dependent epimerase/dehydratase family protein [Acidimicrobiales bacterium]
MRHIPQPVRRRLHLRHAHQSYGPGDNYDLEASHVIPALVRKFHEAKINGVKRVEIWGTGSAMREFLHVDDLAEACIYLMEHYSDESHVNVGTGEDLAIKDLANMVRKLSTLRRAGLRYIEARWHPSQGARRFAPPQCRLEAHHRPSGRSRVELSVVPRITTTPPGAYSHQPRVRCLARHVLQLKFQRTSVPSWPSTR